MNVKLLMVLTGFSSLIVGVSFVPPLFLAVSEAPHQIAAFLLPAVLAFTLGAGLIRRGKGYKERLLVREGALLMLLIWVQLIILGMLPYIIAGRLGVFDAFCESVSGFTTTGLSLLPGAETRAIILWRSITQWLGGINIIMLLATIMPQVNTGIVMKLVLPPNMSVGHLLNTMKRVGNGVGLVYIVITAAAFLACLLIGLDWFDSLNLALVMLSTGGCYDSPAVTGFNSASLQIVAILFMLISSGNFILYYQAARRKAFGEIFKNYELRAFFLFFLAYGALISLHLFGAGEYGLADSLRLGYFETASFLSTTGFSTTWFPYWPPLDRHILFLLVFVGGCMASTAGGFKIMRFVILIKTTVQELRRILHPHMISSIFLGSVPVPAPVVGWVLVFFFLYMAVFFVFSLLMSFEGLAELQCMAIVASCLGNIGSAALWAENVASFASLSVFARFLCCILMLLGRIEIFSVLIALQIFFGRNRTQW